jgi:hypothetical protein
MTNDELDRVLKSAAAPQRPDAFWDELPKKIGAKIHWQANQPECPARQPFFPGKAVILGGMGLAVICAIMALVSERFSAPRPGQEVTQMAEARKYYVEIEGLFPNQVQAIVFDQQGAHLVLSDKANVPTSPPYYVRVSDTKGSRCFVTFSGQQIQLDGERCEVLADKQGNVFLVGEDRVWPGNQSSGPIRIEAKPLSALLRINHANLFQRNEREPVSYPLKTCVPKQYSCS